MTPEERQLITDLANRIAQTPPPVRDPEAEELIRTRIGSRPDALYLMTQTVLIQNMALDHARQEIEQLKHQAPVAPQAPGSFLGGGGGGGWGAPQTPQNPQYNAPPPMPMAPPVQPSGMSSFLRSAGTTAAGVAAGALAIGGISSLFGGLGGLLGGGHHQGMGSGFLGGQPSAGEETIVNNYYGEDPERRERQGSVPDDLAPDDNTDYSSTDVPAPDDDV